MSYLIPADKNTNTNNEYFSRVKGAFATSDPVKFDKERVLKDSRVLAVEPCPLTLTVLRDTSNTAHDVVYTM